MDCRAKYGSMDCANPYFAPNIYSYRVNERRENGAKNGSLADEEHFSRFLHGMLRKVRMYRKKISMKVYVYIMQSTQIAGCYIIQMCTQSNPGSYIHYEKSGRA